MPRCWTRTPGTGGERRSRHRAGRDRALSGFSSGLLGSGGALLTLTLLALAGQNAHTAVGTTLVYTLVIGAWAVLVHRHEHRFSPRLALPSASLARCADREPLSGTTIRRLFVGLLATSCLALLAVGQ